MEAEACSEAEFAVIPSGLTSCPPSPSPRRVSIFDARTTENAFQRQSTPKSDVGTSPGMQSDIFSSVTRPSSVTTGVQSSHSPKRVKAPTRTYGRKVPQEELDLELEETEEHTSSPSILTRRWTRKSRSPDEGERDVDHSRTLVASQDSAEEDGDASFTLSGIEHFGAWKAKLKAMDHEDDYDETRLGSVLERVGTHSLHGIPGEENAVHRGLDSPLDDQVDRLTHPLECPSEAAYSEPRSRRVDTPQRRRRETSSDVNSDDGGRPGSNRKRKSDSMSTSLVVKTRPTSLSPPSETTIVRNTDPTAGPSSRKKKLKAPTKKDLRESKRETARILADQHVSIAHSQQASMPVTAWLEKVIPDRQNASKGENLQVPTSDPIDDFSPHKSGAHSLTLRSKRGTAETQGSTSRSQAARAIQMTVSTPCDSDDDQPVTATDLVKAHEEKVAKQKELERLTLYKTRILERKASHLQVAHSDDESDEDDLEIGDDSAVHTKSPPFPKMSKHRSRHLALAHIGPSASSKSSLSTDVSVTPLKAPSAFIPRHGKVARDEIMQPRQVVANVLAKAKAQAEKIKQQKQRDWQSMGGSLRTEPLANPQPVDLTSLLEAVRKPQNEGETGSSSEESDEWTPEQEGSIDHGSGEEEGQRFERAGSDHEPSRGETPDEDSGESDEEPIHRGGRRRPQLVDSDEESVDQQHVSAGRLLVADTSTIIGGIHEMHASNQDTMGFHSVQSHICDGEDDDKENNGGLMYDSGDDKENAAVVRHSTSEGRGSNLFASLPTSPVDLTQQASRGMPQPTARRPFQLIRVDTEDAFSCDEEVVSRPQSLRASLSFNLADALEGASSIKPPVLHGGFSQLFDGPTQRVPDSDSEEGDAFAGLRSSRDDGELSLSLDAPGGLQPAFEVSHEVLRKAADIFQKEQEIVIEAAHEMSASVDRLDLYVKDDGFLTQTRPEIGSLEIYRPEMRSPPIGFSETQQSSDFFDMQAKSQRMPLTTLSVTTEVESPTHQTTRRLHKRSKTPTSSTGDGNLFPIFDQLKLAKVAKQPLHMKSHYIHDTAEESDDDTGWGYDQKQQSNEEEDDSDTNLDAIVPELLDDARMDRETLGEDRVLEKVREHQEQDDAENERIHRDATDGKLRTKRGRRGLDVDDGSSEEEDEDVENRRRKMYKKRRIDSDNLEDLGRHPETVPFYNAYQEDLKDEDLLPFSEIGSEQGAPLDEDDMDDDTYENVTRGTIDTSVIRRELQQIAEQRGLEIPKHTATDGHMRLEHQDEDEFAVITKEVRFDACNAPVTRMEDGWMRTRGIPTDQAHLLTWAKEEGPRARNMGTGRAGGAVTSLTRKTNAGTTQRQMADPRTVSKRPARSDSILSTVADKQHRFDA